MYQTYFVYWTLLIVYSVFKSYNNLYTLHDLFEFIKLFIDNMDKTHTHDLLFKKF